MARVKTFVNGGSLLPGDLNSIQDDYETSFAAYRDVLFFGQGGSGSFTTGQTYMLGYLGSGAGVKVGDAASAASAFYIDPADRTAGTRTTKYRLRTVVVNNSVAPACNFTFGLYPVASFSGSASAAPGVATVGTVVAGSTATVTAPPVSVGTVALGTDFTAPAAGWYVLGMTVSAAPAATSAPAPSAALQFRQV